MSKYLIITIVVLLAVIGAGWQQMNQVNEKWKVAEANVKAYSEELSIAGKKNTALQLTVDQLGYFNDSVLQALDNTRKELKIKDLDNNYLLVIEVDDDAVSFEGTKEYLDIAEAKIKYNGSNLNLNKYTFFEIDVDPNNQDEYEFTGCEVKALKDVKFKKDDRVIFDVSNKLCYVIKGMEKED